LYDGSLLFLFFVERGLEGELAIFMHDVLL